MQSPPKVHNNFDQLIQLYFPTTNTNFTNQLLISKMMLPQPTKVSLEPAKFKRCHQLNSHLNSTKNSKTNKSDQKTDNFNSSRKKIAIKLFQNKNKRVYGKLQIRVQSRNGSHRYSNDAKNSNSISNSNQKYNEQEIANHVHLTARQMINKIKNEPKTIQRYRSINRQINLNQQQLQHLPNHEQKAVRMSISRMLQRSTDRNAFNYLTKFYKKPIQQQIQFKKTKKLLSNFNQILNIGQFRPLSHNSKHTRVFKSGQNRCRCLKNTLQLDMNRLNKTSELTHRKKQRSSLQVSPRKPTTSQANPRRNVITLNLPENWTVDSWNTQNKFGQQNASVLEKGFFKQ